MKYKRCLQLFISLGLSLIAALLALLLLSALALAQTPIIAVDKTPASQNVLANSTVTFTIRVTNTGDVTLTNFSLSDPQCTSLTGPNDPTLSVNEFQTFTCVVQNVTGDFTNVATAQANSDFGPAQASDNADVNVVAPRIDVEKNPLTQTVASGANAIFTITVKNIGDITLTNLQVSDPQCNSLTGSIGNLTPNQTRTFTCTINNISDGIINIVTATATPQNGPNITVRDVDGAGLILTAAAQACSIDPIAYLKLDESSGPTYDDFFSGHDGKCTGAKCPVALVRGKVNGAQTFDGIDDEVSVPDVPGNGPFDWGQNASFSIELWAKGIPGKTCSASDLENEVIIGRDDSSTNLHWWFGCRNVTGAVHFRLGDTTGNFQALEGPAITNGAWHHLVAIRDGAGSVNRLYVDGNEVASASKVYAAGFESSIAALNIGWLNLSSKFHFEGAIDEVALYNKALSLNEIQAHYNNGLPGPGYCGGPFAPTIVSSPPTTVGTGQPYTYTVIAVGSPIPTYTLITQPTGMTINTTSGVIVWTPALDQEGLHNVQVQASNVQGTDSQTFTVGVGTSNTYLPLVIK